MALPAVLQRHRDRAVLVACIVAAIVLLGLPGGLRFNLARGLGNVVYAPANGALWLGGHLRRLQGENEALRERLMTLADEWRRGEEYRREAVRLRRLLEFRDRQSYRFLPAELLSYPVDFRERNLLRIDRGRRDGVREGMPVVGPGGLIGSVFTVHDGSAEVHMLASADCAVSCRDRRSRVLGVLKWDPRRGFSVDRVELGEDVQAGDLFMTSGLGSRFPEGFLVGTVKAVTSPPGSLHQDIRLEPAAPLARLEDVFVVTAVSYDAPGFPVPFVEPVDSTALADSLARADSLAAAHGRAPRPAGARP